VAGLTALWTAVVVALPAGPFTTDEGELFAQLRQLARTGTWTMPNAAAELDPTGAGFPIWGIEQSADGWLPYVKHPAWTRFLQPFFEMGGTRAVLLVHVVALVVAAGAAARLAGHLGAHDPRRVLWWVGLASPVAVGSLVGWGHAVGAALVTVALVGLARPAQPAPSARGGLLVLGAALAAGILVRNEVVLVAVAIGVVAAARRRWSVAAVAAASSVAAYLVNQVWIAALWGEGARAFRVVDDTSWLAGRLDAATTMLVGVPRDGVGVGALVASLLGAALVARGGGRERTVGAALAVAAPVGLLVATGGRPGAVAGLLVVAPLVAVATAGPATVVTSTCGFPARAEVGGVVVLSAAMVLGTAYADGGGLQWGARFLHVLLPAAVVLVVASGLLERLGPASARALLVASVLWTVAGLAAVVELRSLHGDVVDDVVAAARSTPAGDGGAPVVVGDMRALGAMLWEHLDLRAVGVEDEAALDTLADRAADAGIDRFTLVADPRDVPDGVGAYAATTVRPDRRGAVTLVTMERR